MEADARLHTRLENQSVLIQTAEEEARKGGVRTSTDWDCWVEFTKELLTEKLFNCVDIRCSKATVVSIDADCNNWYDCTLNAVRTAENKPAYSR